MPGPARSDSQLSEQLIQDSFHSYLKSSLAQATAERLLDADILSSAQADLMITGCVPATPHVNFPHLNLPISAYLTGPALCLYFAALRCTTNPPSVPLPRLTKNSPPLELSFENCPPVFTHFLRVWAETVPKIQSLAPEYQHDLARVICGLPPISQPLSIAINGIAADLRAVAIEISQRRSFQNRYASDLQAALDAGGAGSATGGRSRKVSFVPPPMYEESPSPPPAPSPTPGHSPSSSVSMSRSHSQSQRQSRSPSSQTSHGPQGPSSPRRDRNRDLPPLPLSPGLLSPTYRTPGSSSRPFPQRSTSPTILSPDSPALEFIRETLYASLGDVLERLPSLRQLLKRDPPRAYFASVAFAILEVAATAVASDGSASIVGVLGTSLSLADCPPELRPFMAELVAIGARVREVEEMDNRQAMESVQKGEAVPEPILDRVKLILEHGVGRERGRGRGSGRREGSVEGRAVTLANRINALSLAMTKLKAFRERQDEVFKVLAGIGT
ncbi:hypothetical protein AX17_007140 [Amanita inopinata Kibby_2008]|nr:hypothetical protein AX17_007140 [Amanita inopinata Kibby_2008]